MMNKKSKAVSNVIAVSLVVAIAILSGCATLTFPTAVCHANDDPTNPYTAITVNNADELLVHRNHANDIFPMPEGGCPTAPVEVNNGKITICHATGSAKNPYNEITVSIQGLNGHDKHEGDIIPMPAGGCPQSSGENPNKK
jgi:hypothetical protein